MADRERVAVSLQAQDDPRPYNLGWHTPGELVDLFRAWSGDRESIRCRAQRCSAFGHKVRIQDGDRPAESK